jgi:hypothetical protein
MNAGGLYEATRTTPDEMMHSVAHDLPQVLFLDGHSEVSAGKDILHRMSEFLASAFKDAARLIVLNPSELEVEVLFGPPHVTAPHTCEKLVAIIEGTWGKATEQPFNLDFFLRETPGRSENFQIKERQLLYSTYVNKELESERRCTPTSDQWLSILRMCDEVDIWSFPNEVGDLMAEDGFRYCIGVKTFERWLESDGHLGNPPGELAEMLLRLRAVLLAVLSAVPSKGAGDDGALQNSPEDSLSAFQVRIGRPTGWYLIHLVAGKLYYRTAPEAGSRWSAGIQIKPGPEQWNIFWQIMDAVSLWDWLRYYKLPAGDPIAEIVSWEIVIQRADAKAVFSRGHNAYPAGADFSQSVALDSRRFRLFVEAVRRLIGQQPFF